jgi:predicted nucleic acid-binding protein
VGTLVVDSSLLIAAASETDPLHSRALALARRRRGPDVRVLLPAVAYAEVLVDPIRSGRATEMDDSIRSAGLELVPVDRDIAREAARALAERRNLRLPDALVIATALVHDAELLTLDRRMRDAHVALKTYL